eukprot:3613442-Karenia_brevis.AAC.2
MIDLLDELQDLLGLLGSTRADVTAIVVKDDKLIGVTGPGHGHEGFTCPGRLECYLTFSAPFKYYPKFLLTKVGYLFLACSQ